MISGLLSLIFTTGLHPVLRIRIGSGPDPKLPPTPKKRKKLINFMFKEFSVELEASLEPECPL
jgi:hypothetical protein